MLYEHIELLKAALVQQQCQTLSGRKLSLGMLGVNPFLTASQTCRLTTLDKGVDLFVLNLIVHNLKLMQMKVLPCNTAARLP